MKKYQREIKKSIQKLRNEAPEYRTRSIEEMELILHRARVIARKRQIELVKYDNEIPYKPYDISSYINKESRIKILKVIWSYLRFWTLQLRP